QAQSEVHDDPVQDHAVKVVDARPAELAAAHLLHGRRIAGPPGERELAAVDTQPQAVDMARDGAVPVHHRAEDVEGDNPYHLPSLANDAGSAGARRIGPPASAF